MKTYEYQGRSVEEAIDAGLEELGVTIGDVNVVVLEEGAKGLFGLFGSRLAKVRLELKHEENLAEGARRVFQDSLSETPDKKEKTAPKKKEPAKRKESSKKQEKEATEEKSSAITPAEIKDAFSPEGKAQSFLMDVTRLMGVEVEVHANLDEEGNVRIVFEGDSRGILIGRRGDTLDALQYLTSLYVNKGQEDYTRVTLDSEGYRARREEALIRLAHRMANRARKTGRRVALESMNPYERRIIHSALQKEEGVSTHSEGEDPNRHIVITLNRGQREQEYDDFED
ncbi:MAG TPA: protein jag [Clostridiales bacterium]|jgi:spoIIIJ-associated protein|nr:protein jag [Clostridiales bacterium]